MWILVTIFGVFIDYIGYNLFSLADVDKVTPRKIAYRIVMFIVGASMWYWLYTVEGWTSVGYCSLVMWTWGRDILYYALFDWLRWFRPELAGHAFRDEVWGNRVTWAWWTPIGLARTYILGYSKDEPMHGAVLLAQASAGWCVSLIIWRIV